MKTLDLDKMDKIDAGRLTQAELCGIGVGIAYLTAVSGVGFIVGASIAAVTCLTGDS